MTTIRIASNKLEMWLYQNGFNGDATDCLEGCLLDNMLVDLKRGVAAIYEKALNCWTSCYLIEFAPYKNKTEVSKVEADWYEFVDRENE